MDDITLYQLMMDIGRKEGNVLFNDALNTFYLRLYGAGHMVEDHSDSKRGNPLPPHGLVFPITPVVEHWLEREIDIGYRRLCAQ